MEKKKSRRAGKTDKIAFFFSLSKAVKKGCESVCFAPEKLKKQPEQMIDEGGLVSETMIYCPFCQKQTIKAFHRPTFRRQDHASQYKSKRNEEFVVLSGCSNCGKTQAEVKEKV